MTQPIVHVITPGDHYSPRTGSATVTVVHGLSAHRPAGVARPHVAVAQGTYPDRYDSADVIEYTLRPQRRVERYADAALSRFGAPRWFARRRYGATVEDQADWPNSIIVGHNAVQLVRAVDTDRHRAVLYAHNDLLSSYGPAEASRALSTASAIIAVSDFLAETTSASLPPYLRSRVAVVKNGVDLELFRPRPARDDEVLRVVYVGRVVREKGLDVLVDAVVRLKRPDVGLTVIGSAGFDAGLPLTDYEQAIRARAESASARIRFRPFTPRAELATLLGDADVVVVPSRWPEPFALTVLEGMASGAAVIGSDIGGIPESVRGVGVLVPPDDVDALAQAIEGFADDRRALERVRNSCLLFARQNGWDAASADFYRLVDSIG